jgi:hypothetical protein
VAHGSVTRSPAPSQTGHSEVRGAESPLQTTPAPPQCEQVAIRPPGREPLVPQASQADNRSTATSAVRPAAAWSKASSTGTCR